MTKKRLTSGRFGPRYGTRSRKRISEIEAEMKKDHECPVCKYKKVRREGFAIWVCKKCGAKFAGGAYKPKVGLTALISTVRQREAEKAKQEIETAEEKRS